MSSRFRAVAVGPIVTLGWLHHAPLAPFARGDDREGRRGRVDRDGPGRQARGRSGSPTRPSGRSGRPGVSEPLWPTGLRSQVRHGLGWKAMSQTSVQVMALVTTIFIAHLLTPSEVGIVAMATVFSALALILSDLALGAALVQRETLTEEDRSSAFWLNIGFGATLTLAGARPGRPDRASLRRAGRRAAVPGDLADVPALGARRDPERAAHPRHAAFAASSPARSSRRPWAVARRSRLP